MARINLLPWREQRRELRRKRFHKALAAVLLGSLAMLFGADRYLQAALERQRARNAFVQSEIAVLDARIVAIRELRERRAQLLERMQIIQDLQGNRPVIARIFDQLVRTLPDGLYFTALQMREQQIDIEGVAEANQQVSELMRNLDASPWLAAPGLTEVRAAESPGTSGSLFRLGVRQVMPAAQDTRTAPEDRP